MPIMGLQVDVKSDELKKILDERLAHHAAKAKTYSDKATQLRAQLKDLDEDMEVGKVTSGDPSSTMEQKAREHTDKVNYYRFMIDHVIQNDVYRLGQEDLARLGISTRYY